MLKSRLRPSVLAFALAFAFVSSAQAGVETFEIDKTHSNVVFKIKHLLSKVTGQFNQFSGTVEIDPEKRDTVNVSGSVDVASIDTDNQKRDDHLRSPEFFDAAKFPKMTFKGNKLTDVNSDRTKGKLEGTLTIHGVSKPVVLDVEWFGSAKDPWGNQKVAFSGTTKLNRKDFGIVWNKNLETGGFLLGDEVEVEITAEAQVPKEEKK